MRGVVARVGRAPRALGWVPVLGWVRGYRRDWLRGDVLAGVTVAAYLVPQVMAYAGIAGLTPVAGLWAALAALAIYAVFGSSRQLSVGPESTTALMTAAAVGPLAAGDPGRYAALAAALAVVVGLMALAARVVRLGFVADLLSQPILVGYLAGVAVVMIVSQLGKTTGVPVSGQHLYGELASFARHIGAAEVGTVALSVTALAFLFLLKWRRPGVPGPLVAVVLATAAVAVFDLDAHGIAVVGGVPGGLPRPTPPAMEDLASLVIPALGVLFVGYTDNVLTARAFASRAGHGEIDANGELFALGAANLGTGLLSGFPVSSSGSRTALGAAAGSRSQLHSLVAVGVVLGVLLFLRPALAAFPTAVLGAIVIYAAVQLVDVAGFRRLARFRRSELLLALAALAGVLAFDILYGILIAVALSLADLLARVARPHDAILAQVPGVEGMHDIDDYPDAELIAGLVIYRYDSPIFFANARNFHRRALAAVDAMARRGPVEWFVLNMEANTEVDITGLDALEDLRTELAGRGIVVALARVKQELRDDLVAHGVAGRIGADLIFPTLPAAVAAYAGAAGRPRRP
ncbi:sulfate permease [Frankia sp. CNm7]|nr:sulfate permease [Frankia nepalensis]MBL7513729.1 sulfate permease [Frankia nepalensis]MBL7522884.1 sulfate permease [Frankia nepalensis]